jgi:group I intron endonuclease
MTEPLSTRDPSPAQPFAGMSHPLKMRFWPYKGLTVSGIYCIEHVPTGRRYLGSAYNLIKRRQQHYRELRDGKHFNRHLQSAVRKYGFDEFRWIVLEVTASDKHSRYDAEQRWLNTLPPDSYNVCPCPRGTAGRPVTDESRRKMSESRRSWRPSKEFREHLSLVGKGRKLSRESIEKGAAKRRGVPLSESHRESLRRANLGKRYSAETRKRVGDASRGKPRPRRFGTRLDTAKVFEIKRRLAAGESRRSLSNAFSVDYGLIRDIHRGVAWAWVNVPESVRIGLQETMRPECRDKGNAKLNRDQAVEIKRRLATGEQPRCIATSYGVTSACVRMIGRGMRWRDAKVPGEIEEAIQHSVPTWRRGPGIATLARLRDRPQLECPALLFPIR